jgi:hypothetical protein
MTSKALTAAGRLQQENAALRERVAQLERDYNRMHKGAWDTLEQLTAAQAAIEQMREALSRVFHHGMWPTCDMAAKALALQPCPEMLNKVRADAIRDGLAAWDNTVEPIYKFMNDYAQRIEQGEA